MQANYLVFCRGAGSREHLHDRTAWMLASLRSGQVPEWLEAVPGGRPNGLVVLKTRAR